MPTISRTETMFRIMGYLADFAAAPPGEDFGVGFAGLAPPSGGEPPGGGAEDFLDARQSLEDFLQRLRLQPQAAEFAGVRLDLVEFARPADDLAQPVIDRQNLKDADATEIAAALAILTDD